MAEVPDADAQTTSAFGQEIWEVPSERGLEQGPPDAAANLVAIAQTGFEPIDGRDEVVVEDAEPQAPPVASDPHR